MDSAAQIRSELARELSRVRLLLLGRHLARTAVGAVAWSAGGVMLAALFVQFIPWLATGHALSSATVLLLLSSVVGAGAGVWRSFSGWSWPTEADCALAIESEHADASLPTAVELDMNSSFATPVLARARESAARHQALRLGAAVTTSHFVAAPLLALCAALAAVAGAGLPAAVAGRSPVPPEVENSGPLRGQANATDVAAYEQAMGERQKQAALAKAASDLRDETLSDAEVQRSLEQARSEAARASATAEQKEEIPEKVPAGKAEREALAGKLEAAAAAAGARAEAIERGRGFGETDSGGAAGIEASSSRPMERAPAYESRRFEDTREAVSDQRPARRELAQTAVEALAKIKQGR